jgi:hypothetical protein
MYSFLPPPGLPEHEFPIFPDYKNNPSVIIETIGFLTLEETYSRALPSGELIEGNFYISFLIDHHKRILSIWRLCLDPCPTRCFVALDFDCEQPTARERFRQAALPFYLDPSYEHGDGCMSIDGECPINMIKEMKRNFFCCLYARIFERYPEWVKQHFKE